jgi:ABC-type multidrug transport system fused ATPase/permease subunit
MLLRTQPACYVPSPQTPQCAAPHPRRRLPAGELMIRTSGDSLTLRSMLTTTLYAFVEGVLLLLGATGCLLFTLGPLWRGAPGIAVVLLVGLAISGLEGTAAGLGARALNRRVRQSLGHMFGFRQGFYLHSPAACVAACCPHTHTHTHKL